MKNTISVLVLVVVIVGVGYIATFKTSNPQESNPGNFRVPTSDSIPDGFVGRILYESNPNEGYGAEYKNTKDINGSGNPAGIFIVGAAIGDTPFEKRIKYYEDLNLRENRVVVEFEHNNLRGFVFNNTKYPGNIDHTLMIEDGLSYYKISTRDGTTNKFSVDDLIAIYKTLE